jgi:hypothetical protein
MRLTQRLADLGEIEEGAHVRRVIPEIRSAAGPL